MLGNRFTIDRFANCCSLDSGCRAVVFCPCPTKVLTLFHICFYHATLRIRIEAATCLEWTILMWWMPREKEALLGSFILVLPSPLPMPHVHCGVICVFTCRYINHSCEVSNCRRQFVIRKV